MCYEFHGAGLSPGSNMNATTNIVITTNARIITPHNLFSMAISTAPIITMGTNEIIFIVDSHTSFQLISELPKMLSLITVKIEQTTNTIHNHMNQLEVRKLIPLTPYLLGKGTPDF